MATGLPDNEARNEAEQTNELDLLNQTMSGVKDFLGGQLESLQAIARWQDQTALYTSHLQNIKVDMNAVRKWGEPINRIATRIDHMSTTLDAIAAAQVSNSDGDGVDAKALMPALTQIAQNTRETADNINVLAMAIREDREDKREVIEKVKPETESKKNKKEKDKAEGTVKTAFSEVGSFFKKLLGWLAVSTLALVPIFMGSDKLFAQLNTFFKSVFGFFVQVTKFFMQNVAPAINFLFEGLVTFFNKLTGPLGRLGTEIGNQLKIIGPKLFNAINPILDFIGNGIIKAVDFFTSVVALIGPALDTIGNFVTDISKKFQTSDSELTAKVGGFMEYIEQVFQKIMGADPESLMVSFRRTLDMMYNGVLDMAQKVVLTMMHVRLFLDDTYGKEEFARDSRERIGGLEALKIMSAEEMDRDIDRLHLNSSTDNEIMVAEDERMQADGIGLQEREIAMAKLAANLPQMREVAAQRGRTRIGELEKADVKTVDVSNQFGKGITKNIAIDNVQSVIPNFPYNYAKAAVTPDGKVIPSTIEYGKDAASAVNSAELDSTKLEDDMYNDILGLFQAVNKNPDAVGVPVGAPAPEKISTVPLSQMVPPKAQVTTPPVKTTPASAYQNFMNLNQQLGIPMPTMPSISLNQGGSATSIIGGSSNFFGLDLSQIKGGYSPAKPK